LIALVLENDPPPVRSLRPGVPEELDAAVARCLCKPLAGRFQDIAEVARAFAPFAGPSGHELASKVGRILHPELGDAQDEGSGAISVALQPTVSVTAGGSSTNTAFGRTDPASHKSSKKIALYGGIACATVAAIGIAWAVTRGRDSAPGTVQGSASALAPVSSGELVGPAASRTTEIASDAASSGPSAPPQVPTSAITSAAPEAGPADAKGGRGPGAVPVKTAPAKAKHTGSVFDDRQ
jgi:hypothetical protein